VRPEKGHFSPAFQVVWENIKSKVQGSTKVKPSKSLAERIYRRGARLPYLAIKPD